MFCLIPAILLLTLNSALAAPLASVPLIDPVNVDAQHQHVARNLCPIINSVQMSWKTSKPWTSKATVQLDGTNVRLERGSRCVYPIVSGWPGLAKGVSAAAILPVTGADERENLLKLSMHAELMRLSGDLIQDNVMGDYKEWIVVNRSGKHIMDTTTWRNFFSTYEPSQAGACEFGIFPDIDRLLIAQIKEYGKRDIVHPQLNFDRILFDDKWQTVRFIDWPLGSLARTNLSLEDSDIKELISDMDIQPTDGYFVDDAGRRNFVGGTCHSGSATDLDQSA